ncbi:MAG: phage tail protein [Cyanobacteria bacterium SBLK]|nr:phage tail protein [Cyanobacteria bacterium SBLK]
MARFGIIAEGITDQVVIENILMGYFDTSDLDIIDLQPKRNKDASSFGGWEQVLRYCQEEDWEETFQLVDYVIIHIDTDVCEHPNFNIPKYEAGRELSVKELRDRTIQKLQTLIGETFYSQFSEQFFFAIAIHSIECWLLPLYCSETKQAEQIKNCEKRLKRALTGELAKFTKTYDDYDRLSENYYLNPKKFPQYYPKNPSFQLFIEDIKTRNITI